ncbi:probable LRR receptor-like serine/threonine-protein kinase At3g47570 [Solanum tuberosum]|uniref:probable LRR receptor-like serine/threonine-protein kinase At3g47570 n=1 Tax=Solanum tuberosum TaxID=4113 RepID=UPI00073A4B7A|nr:PREDICTED: probable LRR receptor-like serine/threonine-protein kinase At3g47570 [Solanum tuberosum]
MDLSTNKLSNGIPKEIGSLQNLIYLSLRDNKLQGSIPSSMSSVTSLEFLDLSHNNVSGLIPTSLEKLQNLKYFNKLVGEIPSSGPFKNLSGQSFISNEALCGSPRFLCIRGKRKQAVDSSYVVSTRGRISYYELLRATDSLSESNLIGSGSFGSVYKGILREGTSIAAKVFNLQLQAAFRSFDTKCQFLRNLRHRNLTKVITSCSNLEFKALVLEYMSNGSLDKCLSRGLHTAQVQSVDKEGLFLLLKGFRSSPWMIELLPEVKAGVKPIDSPHLKSELDNARTYIKRVEELGKERRHQEPEEMVEVNTIMYMVVSLEGKEQ